MISTRLIDLVRCPDCRGVLTDEGDTLTCPGCRARYGRHDGDYLDLRPAHAFSETTKYLDEALHADARHETVSPPLLSAGVRNEVLRRQLAPAPGDVLVDLGCGSGRGLVWIHDLGAATVGVDVSPHFAREALRDVDLVLGDLRRLPFGDGSFTKAYALDVLEHLSRGSLVAMLAEANRVLAPGGRLFVYTHVRKNSRLAGGLRAINRLARGLERIGLIDMTQERLRKSDHVNPLSDVDDLRRVVGDAGFRIGWIRFYTPLVGAFIENIMMRVAERILARRAEGRAPAGEGVPPASGLKAARTSAKARLARRGPLYGVLRALTWVMMLDLWLFGRVRSGPFFAVLVKVTSPH